MQPRVSGNCSVSCSIFNIRRIPRIIPFRFNALIHEPLPVRISRAGDARQRGGWGEERRPGEETGREKQKLAAEGGRYGQIQSVTRTFTIWIPLV